MEKAADRRAGKFSLGMSQRLGIAAALLGDPAVLLLDEPVNGLDPEGIRWIRNLLKNLAAQGRTVLVSSHLISEVAQTADHLIVVGQGACSPRPPWPSSPPAATPSRRRSSPSPRAAPSIRQQPRPAGACDDHRHTDPERGQEQVGYGFGPPSRWNGSSCAAPLHRWTAWSSRPA